MARTACRRRSPRRAATSARAPIKAAWPSRPRALAPPPRASPILRRVAQSQAEPAGVPPSSIRRRGARPEENGITRSSGISCCTSSAASRRELAAGAPPVRGDSAAAAPGQRKKKAGHFASRPLSDLVIFCSVYVSCVLYNLNPRSFRFLAHRSNP
jgi:hypothetical protein